MKSPSQLPILLAGVDSVSFACAKKAVTMAPKAASG
jgi:hypothetical protein